MSLEGLMFDCLICDEGYMDLAEVYQHEEEEGHNLFIDVEYGDHYTVIAGTLTYITADQVFVPTVKKLMEEGKK